MMSIVFFLMIRRPPRSTLDRSSAASDVYKRQGEKIPENDLESRVEFLKKSFSKGDAGKATSPLVLSLIHISEPTRPY